MTYRVIWRFSAIQQLRTIETSAVDPQSVRLAAAFMEYALRRAPNDFGEGRFRSIAPPTLTVRLWYWDVLGILFTVNEDAMEVEIISVAPARRR